jgi:peroxiredoxin
MNKLLNRPWFLSLITLVATGCLALAMITDRAMADHPQEESGNASGQDLATIRGSLELKSDVIGQPDWPSMQGMLGELVPLKQPELPTAWKDMAATERQQWLDEFYQTDEGKRLQEKNQQILQARHQQEFSIRDGGKFVIYDVPQGRFEMRITAEAAVDEKTWLLQAYGQFVVGDVDELDFSGMPMEVLRVLKRGEQAPPVAGKTIDGKLISLSDLRGKHVLMAFGLTSHPAFANTSRLMKEASAAAKLADRLTVLTVTVDEDVQAVANFNRQQDVTWPTLNLGGWNQQVLHSYGLKSVPSLWLVDPEGGIVLTGRQMVAELNLAESFPELLEDAMAGRFKSEAADAGEE